MLVVKFRASLKKLFLLTFPISTAILIGPTKADVCPLSDDLLFKPPDLKEESCPSSEIKRLRQSEEKCPFAQPVREDTSGERMSVEDVEIAACCKACKTRNPATATEYYYDINSKDYYFDSYAHFGIHEDMIKDEVRTNTYRQAIQDNPHLFKGKTVLDVGSGLGILSLFAAKAGAARVIGIEGSTIAELGKQIIRDNNMTEVVTIIKGQVEEIELPDGIEKVDIIISEWMGYCLLFESMLSTVIYARDKWLKPGGLMFPDSASIFLTAIEDRVFKNDKILWWNNVYGFNMSAVGKVALLEPIVDLVDKKNVVTTSSRLKTFDLYKVKVKDMTFTAPFSVRARRPDYVHALVVFFSVEFLSCHTPTGFSTGPETLFTHWKQTIFYLRDFIMIQQNEEISGHFSAKPNLKSRRDLDVRIVASFQGKLGTLQEDNHYKVR
ncbi:protein arginine N-methyltransferase 1-like [Homalodisca vitripennis]|uniref:protein arginine N-methyltransferase 1-like n=1 Tax=Homalodisca vitripennis TaxID=197043 RepID=UPI001EEA46AE|nr:protein arginine N-methyltransferase 1-like [Homalodisca vitripennis]